MILVTQSRIQNLSSVKRNQEVSRHQHFEKGCLARSLDSDSKRNLQTNALLLGKVVEKEQQNASVVLPKPVPSSPQIRGKTIAIILGGGAQSDEKLFPLTSKRTLPAIPFGGMYRLIDIPISNCINSGINKIYVLTQYNSTSLNRYLTHAYNQRVGIPSGGDGFVEIVANTQFPNMPPEWSKGPADAMRQAAWIFDSRTNTKTRQVEELLVLCSDHVYRTDFERLVGFHRENNADITIACVPVSASNASTLGVLQAGTDGRVLAFAEKPRGVMLEHMRMSPEGMRAFLQDEGGRVAGAQPTHLGSCGILLFRREVLLRLLEQHPSARDFGGDLMPEALADGLRVLAYPLPDFWRDVGGSVADFYDANLQLLNDPPQFELATSVHRALFTEPHSLPPSTVGATARLKRSLISAGSRVEEGAAIVNSVLGLRSIVGRNARLEDTVMMGADYYEDERPLGQHTGGPSAQPITGSEDSSTLESWAGMNGDLPVPPLGIGEGSVVRRAIVDKNARIGRNCTVVNKEGVQESMDLIAEGIAIRDGIIVISKSSVLFDNTCI